MGENFDASLDHIESYLTKQTSNAEGSGTFNSLKSVYTPSDGRASSSLFLLPGHPDNKEGKDVI